MKAILSQLANPFPTHIIFNWTMLVFRILLCLQLMTVHGFKKLGWGVQIKETIPNPLHLPEFFNQWFTIAANLVFPFFILVGFFTRLCSIPILAVTLTGYFVLHKSDTLLVRDVPFVYSLCFLLLLCLGAGKYSLDRWFLHEKLRR
jgi:putative oxidoreductase